MPIAAISPAIAEASAPMMPAQSPAAEMPATDVMPKSSTTGRGASCASSQVCAQPSAIVMCALGTTPS